MQEAEVKAGKEGGNPWGMLGRRDAFLSCGVEEQVQFNLIVIRQWVLSFFRVIEDVLVSLL